MTAEIKKLTNKDLHQFKELIRVFEDVFEMENVKLPTDSYLQQLLEKNYFLFLQLR